MYDLFAKSYIFPNGIKKNVIQNVQILSTTTLAEVWKNEYHRSLPAHKHILTLAWTRTRLFFKYLPSSGIARSITHVCRHDTAGPLQYHINMPQAGFDPPIARRYSSTECESSTLTIQATTAGSGLGLFFTKIMF